MPGSHLCIHVKQSRKSHARGFSQSGVGCGYIVEVTGSTLHGNYRVNVAVMESARQPPSKGVFSRGREWFTKAVNVEKIAMSNICILGSISSPNMRGGSEASSIVHARGFRSVINCSCTGVQKRHSSIVCGMLETFARNVKLFKYSHRTKNDSREQLTNPHSCLANFWSVKYKC